MHMYDNFSEKDNKDGPILYLPFSQLLISLQPLSLILSFCCTCQSLAPSLQHSRITLLLVATKHSKQTTNKSKNKHHIKKAL
jgi:hypothetical protein